MHQDQSPPTLGTIPINVGIGNTAGGLWSLGLNLVGLRDVGVCELGQAEVRLHAVTSYPQNADRSCRISAGAGPQTSYLLWNRYNRWTEPRDAKWL